MKGKKSENSFTRHNFIMLGAALFLLNACTTTTVLSDEEPYKSMIGDCYILQRDMNVYESGCWDLGDFILSPDQHSCLEKPVGSVSRGNRIIVSEIRQKQFGTVGPCPQIIVTSDSIKLNSDDDVYIPLCFSARTISWLVDELWFPGDTIELKEEYVKKCPERWSSHEEGQESNAVTVPGFTGLHLWLRDVRRKQADRSVPGTQAAAEDLGGTRGWLCGANFTYIYG